MRLREGVHTVLTNEGGAVLPSGWPVPRAVSAAVRCHRDVLEIGTGSGYSGALLAHLVGPAGQVTSVDIDPYLARWANVAHHERGIDTVRCHATDGTLGHPHDAPYDRLVAWCTPPLLPRTWVDQTADGGIIVTPLPVAAVPKLTVVAKIRVRRGQPHVTDLFHGGYVETAAGAETDTDVPLRWVDWENRTPSQSWISTALRGDDDWTGTGARAALGLLRTPEHTERYAAEDDLDWASWRTFAAATGSHRLTMASLLPETLALGHTTPTTAAVLQEDGTILADAPNSASLTVLHTWLTAWDDAGRPTPGSYSPALDPADDGNGWHLRLNLPERLRSSA